MLARSGSPRPIDAGFTLVGVVLAAGIAWTATTRLRAERLASQDWRAALDAASIAITSDDGTVTHWSRGCEALYGWRADEAVGRNKYALLASRDVPHDLSATFDLGAPGERELIERRKDGAAINVLERRLLLERAGRSPHLVLKMLDISDRVSAEQALQAREAQLRSVIEAAPSAMVVVDATGAIVAFSPAAERLWGYAAAEVIGQPVYTLAAAAEHERLRGVVERIDPRDDAGATAASATVIVRGGATVSVEIYYGRAQTGSGSLVTFFCRDVSERLATERRLGELSAELTHVSRQSAMSELAADLAHELNQPLSATANFLATARMLIDQGGDGERVAELLRMGEEQTLRSGEIIRRLRDFLSKRDVEKRLESIETTVREAVDLVLFGAVQDDIRLEYRLDPSIDLIFADRIQVQQVLVNLLRNAVDALRLRPRTARAIVIASRPTGDDMVEISVSDTGPGLPAQVSTHLYSRFATTKEGAAMGIGLSISRRIVEAHGGTLVAENRSEGGATFRFTLPTMGEIDE